MDYDNQYIGILTESLQRKIQILDQILLKTKEQRQIIHSQDKNSLDIFDKNMQEKDVLIQELNKLDKGFEGIFNRVKEELKDKKEKYANEIHLMKQLISDITEKSMQIQKEEYQTQGEIQKFFKQEKEKVQLVKANKNAALNYYKTMSNLEHVDPQFMDKKK